jgi:hypothetical protein
LKYEIFVNLEKFNSHLGFDHQQLLSQGGAEPE